MTNISKHDSKKKWKCNISKDAWINLFIFGYAISVNNLLGILIKLVVLK